MELKKELDLVRNFNVHMPKFNDTSIKKVIVKIFNIYNDIANIYLIKRPTFATANCRNDPEKYRPTIPLAALRNLMGI